jgi:hypothetical protein
MARVLMRKDRGASDKVKTRQRQKAESRGMDAAMNQQEKVEA